MVVVFDCVGFWLVWENGLEYYCYVNGCVVSDCVVVVLVEW